MAERTIYRWRIDVGLAWHQELAAFDTTSDEAWTDWTGWACALDLADRSGEVVIALSSATGEITFESDGTINFDLDAAETADLTPTSTAGRGKERAQLVGTVYLTDPLYPDDPYAIALVKLVVKEP